MEKRIEENKTQKKKTPKSKTSRYIILNCINGDEALEDDVGSPLIRPTEARIPFNPRSFRAHQIGITV